MFEADRSRLSSLVIHYIGNKLKDDALLLSENESGMDEPTRKILWEYLRSAFKTPDFFKFHHHVDLEMNNVYTTVRRIFSNPDEFVHQSGSLAKLLYEVSQHPNVRSGELMVIYFEKLTFLDVSAPAVALFKSEKKQPFLFTEEQENIIDLFSYQGISPSKVDKACLIFDEEEEDGYKVLSIDNINKGDEAKFWFEEFLKIKTRSTGFAKTSTIIDMTKSFIEVDLNAEGDLERAESIDLMNKTKSYFKENDHFDYDHFNEQVFENEDVGNRFREYATTRDHDEVGLDEGFDISQDAVKKKQRIFKSILKLDKNFHVYIHGNREMIEKGTDENGRKYYKLYFEEEN